MKLSEEDIRLFYKLHPALLFYTNQQMKKSKDVSTLEEFMYLQLEEKVKIRNALCDKIDLVDSFIEENPFEFSAEELEIVQGWRNLVKGEFYLIHYLKKHAIFLDGRDHPYTYGVVALSDEFERILGPYLPIMLETVLLPFKGRIIYDGFMVPYRLTFGRGIRQSLNSAYQESKSKYGIIISLPFSVEEAKQSDANRLRFYIKNKHNRDMYWEEIRELIDKNSNLLILYHSEMGKIHTRTYRKRLRDIGFSNVWFAILEGIVVASGLTRDGVEQILQEILPAEKREFVYIFYLKGK